MKEQVFLPAPTVNASFVIGARTLSRCPPVQCSEESAWHALFTTSVFSDDQELPDQVVVEVTLPAEQVWYLNNRREMVRLLGEVCPSWPVGCFAVLEYGSRLFQVYFDPGAHFLLRQSVGHLTARFTLRNRTACGLRLWGEHKLRNSPSRHSVRIVVSRLAHLGQAIWAEPFPGSARSVICLTDHPDWDSVPKATALWELFAAHNLRITKGVFPVEDPGWNYGPGLNVPAYAATIDRWFQTGHEIAYHGLGSGRDAPASLEECLRRIDLLKPYAPRTWIDHGRGEYGFVRSARLPGNVDLLPALTANGVQNFWSYADAWQNPATHLHIWHARSVLGTFTDCFQLVWRRGLTGPLPLAHLFTIPIKNIAGDEQYRKVLQRPWSLLEWERMGVIYRLLGEINSHPQYLYGLGGDFFLQDRDGTMVFDTILLNHLALQLRPSNIDRLARDNGLLIAHTYLAADNKRNGRNCFRAGNPVRILDSFRENVEHISALQKRADLITLPLNDLRNALVRHAQTRITRRSDGWDVEGNGLVNSRTPYRIAGQSMTQDRHGLFSAAVSGTARLVTP